MTFFYNYNENRRFSNNTNDFFMNIKTLPDELEEIVYSYMPKTATIFVTKQNYLIINQWKIYEMIIHLKCDYTKQGRRFHHFQL